ncbi:MAG: acyl carrier protein [Actinomycetia bacterium]|nr:acyl carrier protein [Actinomycetes bacterium]
MTQADTCAIRDEIVTILTQIKGRDVGSELAADDDFMRKLHLDSLDAVELTVRLGSDFGVEFGAEAEDLDALESLQALVVLVTRRLQR